MDPLERAPLDEAPSTTAAWDYIVDCVKGIPNTSLRKKAAAQGLSSHGHVGTKVRALRSSKSLSKQLVVEIGKRTRPVVVLEVAAASPTSNSEQWRVQLREEALLNYCHALADNAEQRQCGNADVAPPVAKSFLVAAINSHNSKIKGKPGTSGLTAKYDSFRASYYKALPKLPTGGKLSLALWLPLTSYTYRARLITYPPQMSYWL
jgi:hypothetical protein